MEDKSRCHQKLKENSCTEERETRSSTGSPHRKYDHRKYDWNTTHFFPDIHQLSDAYSAPDVLPHSMSLMEALLYVSKKGLTNNNEESSQEDKQDFDSFPTSEEEEEEEEERQSSAEDEDEWEGKDEHEEGYVALGKRQEEWNGRKQPSTDEGRGLGVTRSDVGVTRKELGVTRREPGVTREVGVTRREPGVIGGEVGVTRGEPGVTRGEEVTRREPGVTRGVVGVTRRELGVTRGDVGVNRSAFPNADRTSISGIRSEMEEYGQNGAGKTSSGSKRVRIAATGTTPPRTCVVTHFDDAWPVTEYGITEEELDRTLTKPTNHKSKGLRSILRYNSGRDTSAETKAPVENGAGKVERSRQPEKVSDDEPTLNLQRAAFTTDSLPILQNSREFMEHVPEVLSDVFDGRDDLTSSESSLSLKDSPTFVELEGRKRFVIDLRRPMENRIGSSSTRNRPSDPMTLKEFESCLEVAKEKQRGLGSGVKNEGESVRLDRSSIPRDPQRGWIVEKSQNKPETRLEQHNQKQDSDLFWLFDQVFKNREQRTIPKNAIESNNEERRTKMAEVQTTQRVRPKSANATCYNSSSPNHEESSSWNEEMERQSKAFKEDSRRLSQSLLRQQYRWSTSIREPEARILLDDWQGKSPLSVRSLSFNRHKVPPMSRPQVNPPSSRTFEAGRGGQRNDTGQAERAFTLTGQPIPETARFRSGVDYGAAKKYAVVGVSNALVSDGVHPDESLRGRHPTYGKVWGGASRGVDTEQQLGTIPENVNTYDSSKHRYLRERVLEYPARPLSSVEGQRRIADTAPSDAVLPVLGEYRSLQNLQEFPWTKETTRASQDVYPLNRFNSSTSRSAQSLPRSLLLPPSETDLSSLDTWASNDNQVGDWRPDGISRKPGGFGTVAQAPPGDQFGGYRHENPERHHDHLERHHDNLERRHDHLERRHDPRERRYDPLERHHDHLERRHDPLEHHQDHLECHRDHPERRPYHLDSNENQLNDWRSDTIPTKPGSLDTFARVSPRDQFREPRFDHLDRGQHHLDANDEKRSTVSEPTMNRKQNSTGNDALRQSLTNRKSLQTPRIVKARNVQMKAKKRGESTIL